MRQLEPHAPLAMRIAHDIKSHEHNIYACRGKLGVEPRELHIATGADGMDLATPKIGPGLTQD